MGALATWRGEAVRRWHRAVFGHDLAPPRPDEDHPLAYFEHRHVPLLQRARYGVSSRESGERLLHVTGALDAGLPGSRVFEGSLESCRVHRLTHEVLAAGEVNERFPGFALPDGFKAVFQPDGGFLEPEKCIKAHTALATAHGAEVLAGVRVHGWSREPGGVSSISRAIDPRPATRYARRRLTPRLAPRCRTLRPERQVVGSEIEDTTLHLGGSRSSS
jgi:sarcosine oxidase